MPAAGDTSEILSRKLDKIVKMAVILKNRAGRGLEIFGPVRFKTGPKFFGPARAGFSHALENAL